ncbi:MAG: hypothetical protein NT003_00690 [Candidatus Magasanikbacteria bacterium]|nr:hypothetical protein [Candidatus Magasanikbacteria bacterium]
MWLTIKLELFWIFYFIIQIKAFFSFVLHSRAFKRRLSAAELADMEESGFHLALFYLDYRVSILNYLMYSPQYGLVTLSNRRYEHPNANDPDFEWKRDSLANCVATVRDRFEEYKESYKEIKALALMNERSEVWTNDMATIILYDDRLHTIKSDFRVAFKLQRDLFPEDIKAALRKR